MNAFLRNIERIRDMEREERITETRGATLMKAKGGRKGGLSEEELRRRHRERTRAARALEVRTDSPERAALKARARELRTQGVPTFKIVDMLGISPQALGHLLRGAK